MLGSFVTVCAGLTMSMFAPEQPILNPAPALHPIEARVIEQTNAERARHGLRPLSVDPKLVESARKHAAWMTNSHSMVHTNQPVGENIAMGQTSSREVIIDWMNSPGHRANILSSGYTRIGVAAYTTPSGTIFWCQQFLH